MLRLKKSLVFILSVLILLASVPTSTVEAASKKTKYVMTSDTRYYDNPYDDVVNLKKTETIKYKYDKKGLLVKKTSSLGSSEEYKYNKDGQVAKQTITITSSVSADGINWKKQVQTSTSVYKRTFNEDGKILNEVAKTTSKVKGSKGFSSKQTEEWQYKSNGSAVMKCYDNDGSLISKTMYRSNGTKEKEWFYASYSGELTHYREYDKYGNEVYSKYDDGGYAAMHGTKHKDISKIKYTYTKDGTIKKEVLKVTCRGKKEQTSTFTYYTEGFRKGYLKTETSIYYNENGVESDRYEYIYTYKNDKTKKNVAVEIKKDKKTNVVREKHVYTWKKVNY